MLPEVMPSTVTSVLVTLACSAATDSRKPASKSMRSASSGTASSAKVAEPKGHPGTVAMLTPQKVAEPGRLSALLDHMSVGGKQEGGVGRIAARPTASRAVHDMTEHRHPLHKQRQRAGLRAPARGNKGVERAAGGRIRGAGGMAFVATAAATGRVAWSPLLLGAIGVLTHKGAVAPATKRRVQRSMNLNCSRGMAARGGQIDTHHELSEGGDGAGVSGRVEVF